MDHNKAIALTSDKIKNYLKNLRSEQLASDVLNQTLDLAKEFRSKDYPLIHLLLQNPLAELISAAVPSPSSLVVNPSEGTVPGFLYLFDARVPIERRRSDEIRWNDSKKMSVKLIIFNENSGMYKLKNNKNDEGAVVMRRQTWRADGGDKGWRRNEYKLVVKETYFKQASDGRLSVTEGQSLQEFPVLVHYFWKKSEASGHPRKKRKRGSSFKAEEEEAEVGESPDRNFGESEHIMTMSSLLAQHNPAPGTLAPPASGPSFLSTTSSSSSSSSSSSLPPMATNVRGKRERESVGNSHAMTSAAPRNFFPHPDNFEDSQQGTSQADDELLFSSSSSSSLGMSRGTMSRSLEAMTNFSVAPTTPSLQSPSTMLSLNSPSMGPYSNAVSTPSFYTPRMSVKSEPDEDDFALSSDMVFTSRVENGALVPFTPIPSSMNASATSDSTGPRPAEIKSYAPESGPSTEYSKMILVHNGFHMSDDKCYRFSCLFEEVSVPCTEIAPGVVQCQVPPHKPGIVYFWLACIEESSDTVDLTALPKEGDTVQYSQPVPFYYAPMDPAGRLSLAWELVGHNDILSVMKHFKYTAKELDLSNNGLANIDCLEGFRELNTLILDNNHLTHDTKFPPMPKLRTLSINHNWLIEVDKFLDNIVAAAPNLRYLSTLHNAACPFFSSAKHHYYNYRIYILSRLRKLTHLDSSPVTMEEWRHAECIMPSGEAAPPNSGIEEFNLVDDDDL